MSFNLNEWVSEDVLTHPKRKQRYCVRVRWALLGGRMEPVEIQIGTVQPNEKPVSEQAAKRRAVLPVLSEATEPALLTDLRDIGLQRFIDDERRDGAKAYLAYVAQHGRPPGPTPDGGWTAEALAAHASMPFAEAPRRGPDVPPDEYREVAEVYQRAWAGGDNPREAVADHFKITPDAAAKRVQRARERGYLPKTQQGRARAVPAAKRRRTRNG